MSPPPPEPTRWPRRVLALLFTWELAHQLWSLHEAAPTLWLPALGVAGAALAWWGLRYGGAIWPLVAALACSTAVVAAHRGALYPVESALYPGAMISAWALGRVVARWLLREPDAAAREQVALSAATATLGAIYVAAALSKFQLQGMGWLDPDLLRRSVADFYEPTGHWPLNAWLVESRAAAQALTVFSMVAELSAVLFLVGRRARALSAALLIALHLTLALSTPIPALSAIAVLVVFGFGPGPRPTLAERQPAWRTPILAAGLLALLAVPVTLHSSTGEQRPPEPEGAQLQHLGPITRDQALPGGWEIYSMQWDKGVITIWLEADSFWARVDFWLSGSRDRPYAREKDGITASYFVHESVYDSFAPVFDLLLDAVSPEDLADPLAAEGP
ncbi:MAG: hypothetical protein R3F39_07490 [Myxococcota bacterium]